MGSLLGRGGGLEEDPPRPAPALCFWCFGCVYVLFVFVAGGGSEGW